MPSWEGSPIAGPPSPSTQLSIRRTRLAVATIGHAFSDGFVNLVPPLLYVVRDMFRLSDSGLGNVMMVASLTTNFGQPVFGYLTDRLRWQNVVGLGVLISAVFICAIGFMPNLWLFVAALVFSGMGTALFHPQGGGLAAHASGHRRAFGMSIFGMGGAIGYAGGALASPVLHQLGLAAGMGPLQGFIVALPFGLIVAYLLYAYTRDHSVPAPAARFRLRQHLLPYWRSLLPVLLVMVLRSMTVIAYATFFQVIIGERGLSVYHQGGSQFTFVLGGAVGGIVGAHLSDLWGRRFITVLTLLISPPLLYYSLYTPYAVALALLFLSGLIVRAAEPVNIAQAQDLVPGGISVASSIGMGFAWGIASIVTPLVGRVSDITGKLPYALSLSAFLPVIAAVVALGLPTRPPAAEPGEASAN